MQAFTTWKAATPRIVPDVSAPKKVIEAVRLALAEGSTGEHDRGAVESEVLFEASSAPIVLFTSDDSSECDKALRLLRDTGAEPVVFNLDERNAGGKFKRAALGRITGKYSLPSCWVNGRYVGGFDDGPSADAPGLVKLSFQGRLGNMVGGRGAGMNALMPGADPYNSLPLNGPPNQQYGSGPPGGGTGQFGGPQGGFR